MGLSSYYYSFGWVLAAVAGFRKRTNHFTLSKRSVCTGVADARFNGWTDCHCGSVYTYAPEAAARLPLAPLVGDVFAVADGAGHVNFIRLNPRYRCSNQTDARGKISAWFLGN